MKATPAMIHEGEVLYSRQCFYCHGVGVVSSSGVPDLRYATAATHHRFESIVLGGAPSKWGCPRSKTRSNLIKCGRSKPTYCPAPPTRISPRFVIVLRMRSPAVPQNLKRRILKDALRDNEQRDAAFRRIIRSVPKGKVSTYGKVAAAAGYPLYHRAVARLLRKDALHAVPWQRIVGAGGEIKLRGEAAAEQRLRLTMEGVKFRGRRVNMQLYEHTFRPWETAD